MIDEVKLSIQNQIGKTNKKILLSKIFTILVDLELFVLLLPAWSASPIWNLITLDQYFRLIVNGAQFIFLFFSVIIILLIKRIDKFLLFYLLLTDFIFILSLTFTGFQSGFMAIIGVPLSFLFLFGTIKWIEPSPSIIKPIIYIMMIWSVMPVILFFSIPSLSTSFFVTIDGKLQTFSGLALHRNLYGMIIGIPILVLLTFRLKMPVIFQVIFWILCSVGIFLSGSRTLLLSVLCCLVYDTFLRSKTIFFKRIFGFIGFIIVILFAINIYNQYSIRPEKTNDDRKEIYEGFYKKIEASPMLGEGKPVIYYSIHYPEGAPAHNFILQNSADYGIPMTITFLLILIYIFNFGRRYSRLFLIYCVIWGLTQPYFGYAIPSSQVCVPIFIGYILDYIDSHENRVLHTKRA